MLLDEARVFCSREEVDRAFKGCEKKNPCILQKPISLRMSASSRVSMPSTMTSRSNFFARARMISQISQFLFATNVRSALSASNGSEGNRDNAE